MSRFAFRVPSLGGRAAGLMLSLLAVTSFGAQAQTTPADLALTNINATGVSSPIAFAAPNDGSGRLFIAARGGNIYIYRNGVIESPVFLNVPVSTGGEQGLLGIALHPDFATNGRVFVQHTRAAGGSNIGSTADQVTAEYTVSAGDPDVADPATRKEVVVVGDLRDNHNGGGLHFGPDGMLYISMGDGGVQNDPNGFAACLWKKPENNNPTSCAPGAGVNYALLGKILRIDVNGTTPNAPAEMCGTATGGTANYRIPLDNPHVGTSSTCDEIYHYGMRNPFRFSFDRSNGDMIIGDVGQNTWEEVDLIPSGSGGVNLGWRTCEGRQLRGSTTVGSCNFAVLPILDYLHTSTPSRCSITGGYRYRGPIGPFVGTIVYADYCSREIFFGRPDAGSPSGWSATRWETGAGAPILAASGPIGFGEDVNGDLYVATQNSGVYRFTSASSINIFANDFE